MDRTGKILLFGGLAAVGVGVLLYASSSKAAAPKIAPALPKKVPASLPTGSSGGASRDQIKCVQTALNAQGFSAGGVDGDYGPSTTAAVKRFQAAKGLPQTGSLDTATLASPLGACLVSGAQMASAPAGDAQVADQPAAQPPPYPPPAPEAAAPSDSLGDLPSSGAMGADASGGGKTGVYVPGYGQFSKPCSVNGHFTDIAEYDQWRKWTEDEAGPSQLYQAVNALRASDPPCSAEADYIEKLAHYKLTGTWPGA
jgi:peptidoglycan hydrolase-like protein with peptidoglycan-binding domain